MNEWERELNVRLGKALRLMRGVHRQVDIARRAKDLGHFVDSNEISRYERARGFPTTPKLAALLAALSESGEPDFCALQKRMNEVKAGGDEHFDPEIALFEGETGDPSAQTMFDEIFAEQFAEMKQAADDRMESLEKQVQVLSSQLELLLRRERDVGDGGK